MRKIVISGLVYGQKPTGIYRYANEILLELDKIVPEKKIALVVPTYAKNIPEFKNINIIRYGNVKGLLWEQISLAIWLIKNNARSINFTNSMPLLCPGNIVIHDVSYKVNPGFYKSIHGKLAMWWHRFNYWCAALSKSRIVTVTEYSKKCIIENYRIPENKITVIGNAWQHIERVKEEDGLGKYHLNDRGYFFSLGSLSERKNTKWIYAVAKKYPEYKFVVSGAQAKNSADVSESIPSNVVRTGYITDGEMKNLMKHCKAFIFPSKYEGFGIPPLEAMSLGTPVISSNASCLPEIYEDQVTYIDPEKYEVDLNNIIDYKDTQRILNKYSWKKSAEQLLQFIKDGVYDEE